MLTTNEIDTLLTEVKTLTDNNNHTEAREHIAKTFGIPDFVVLFHSIDAIHGICGHMPAELISLRTKFTAEMLTRIEGVYGADVREKVNNEL